MSATPIGVYDGVDLFAGPGGFDIAAGRLGLKVVGIEKDPAPIATRYASGLRTIAADVATEDPAAYGPIRLLIAAPPCPDFSQSNRRNAEGIDGLRGSLVFEVLRWADVLEPELIACEQVPDVLPIWETFARHLGTKGYSAFTGVLNAADFGVAQTRRRAVLIARRDGGPVAPVPTHSYNGGSLFAPAPWVTMAEALDGLGPFAVRHEPGAPYVEGDLPAWAHIKPSTTVTSGGRVAAPGYRQFNERQFGVGSVRLTIAQAARLQGFPDGHPWQTPRVHQQIGNAVPVGLATAILGLFA